MIAPVPVKQPWMIQIHKLQMYISWDHYNIGVSSDFTLLFIWKLGIVTTKPVPYSTEISLYLMCTEFTNCLASIWILHRAGQLCCCCKISKCCNNQNGCNGPTKFHKISVEIRIDFEYVFFAILHPLFWYHMMLIDKYLTRNKTPLCK